MSALALPALALAQRSAQALPALFTDLDERSPAPDVRRIDSNGYGTEGRGAAIYVADDLCTPALHSAHPRFTFRTANGRVFRLLPEAGSLAVEQGGAAGDGLLNDQPAVQAAIDYAEAIGAREVRFESARYRIDCPVRTSPSTDAAAQDGHPLVVHRSLTLRGCAPDRSVLDFRGVGGADPETTWQTVATSASDPAPAVWRGGGISLRGETSDPGAGQRRIARFELDRLMLKGNRLRTGQQEWPANPATGDGWDITDKALWLQDCYAGSIICRDVDMIGWKGEIFYLGGPIDGVERLDLTRCRLLTSNGSALNPGVNAEIRAIDCEFGDCFQAQEETGKLRALYRNCLWRDCEHMSLGSGPTAAYVHNFAYPHRDPAAPMPQTVLEGCEFRDIGTLYLRSWLSGTIRTVDTTAVIDGNQGMAVRDIDLAIDAWLDRKSAIFALGFFGVSSLTQPVPGAPVGIYCEPPSQIRLTLRHFRTRAAQDAGREWFGMEWNGLIENSCRIECSGDYAHGRSPNGGATPQSMPLVAFAPGMASTAYVPRGYFPAPALNGSGEVLVSGPAMAVGCAAEQVVDVTLARYTTAGSRFGYAEGQRVRLVKAGDTGAIRFAKVQGWSNAVVNATRVLEHGHDWIEFTYNRDLGRWEESGFFSAA